MNDIPAPSDPPKPAPVVDGAAAPAFEPVDEEARRIWWRSRRGLRELDLLLLPFVEDVVPGMGPEEREVYLRLIDHEDTELLEWFTRRAEPEAEDLRVLIERIRRERRPVS